MTNSPPDLPFYDNGAKRPTCLLCLETAKPLPGKTFILMIDDFPRPLRLHSMVQLRYSLVQPTTYLEHSTYSFLMHHRHHHHEQKHQDNSNI